MRRIHFNIPKQQESSDILSEKILFLLEGLKNLDDEIFTDWYQQGWSKKEALNKKVLFEKEYLRAIVNKNWDKKFPELGTKFSLWTGKDNDLYNCVISFSLGKTTTNKNLTNIITIVIPTQDYMHNFDDTKIQSIIALLKEIWGEQDFEIIP